MKAKKRKPRSRANYVIGVFLLLGPVAFLATRTRPQQEVRASYDPDAVLAAMAAKPQEVLKELVQGHPEPEISGELNHLVETGQVYLNLTGELRHELHGNVGRILYVNTPQVGVVLALSFSPHFLLDPNIPRQLKQLVIYHEWMHIKQQRSGDKEKYPDTLAMQIVKGDDTTQTLRVWFEAEFEAYRAECVVAERHEWTQYLDLCISWSKNGDSGLRQAMARSYTALIPADNWKRDVIRTIADHTPDSK